MKFFLCMYVFTNVNESEERLQLKYSVPQNSCRQHWIIVGSLNSQSEEQKKIHTIPHVRLNVNVSLNVLESKHSSQTNKNSNSFGHSMNK